MSSRRLLVLHNKIFKVIYVQSVICEPKDGIIVKPGDMVSYKNDVVSFFIIRLIY